MTASPWRPSVGDRVRVRLVVGDGTCEALPHDAGEASHVGRIVSDREEPDAPDHPYLVVFDARSPAVTVGHGTFRLVARHYAADELEPLG